MALRTKTKALTGNRRGDFSALHRLGKQPSDRIAQQLSGQCELLFPKTVGQESEIADALKAGSQYVNQEWDQLICLKPHYAQFLFVFGAVVLPLKTYTTV